MCRGPCAVVDTRGQMKQAVGTHQRVVARVNVGERARGVQNGSVSDTPPSVPLWGSGDRRFKCAPAPFGPELHQRYGVPVLSVTLQGVSSG